MSQIFLYRQREETPFSKPIKRSLIRDKRLSFGARGVFIFLWDFPSGWSFYMSHLVQFSPAGITQLRGYLRELKNIGALEITPRRLSKEEINEINNAGTKYKAGQILGQRWTLNHPDEWAIEAPLSSKPSCRFSATRPSAKAEKPGDENPDAKGFKHHGSIDFKKQLQATEDKTATREYNFPIQLSPEERNIAASFLAKTDDVTAQKILDVLSEKLLKNKIRGSPIGYLHTLVERASNGQFFSNAGSVATLKSQYPKEKLKEKTTKNKSRAEHAAIEEHINNLFKTLGKARNGHTSNTK